MLTTLELGNFKALGKAQRLPIKPLTLIFGPNSAGKSSIIHALALGHEAYHSGNLDVFQTELGGTSIDLGGFRSYIFKRNTNSAVHWSCEIDITKSIDWAPRIRLPGKRLSFIAKIGIHPPIASSPPNSRTPGVPYITAYDISLDAVPLLQAEMVSRGRLRIKYIDKDHPYFRHIFEGDAPLFTGENEVNALKSLADQLIPELRIDGPFVPNRVRYSRMVRRDAELYLRESQKNMMRDIGIQLSLESSDGLDLYRRLHARVWQLLAAVRDLLGQQLHRLKYLGPLRSYPPRQWITAQPKDPDWHAGGAFAWELLREDRSIRERVNEWFDSAQFQTRYSVDIKDYIPVNETRAFLRKIADHITGADQSYFTDSAMLGPSVLPPDQYRAVVGKNALSLFDRFVDSGAAKILELNLIDRRTDTVVSHRDIGFGISQVLPILVSCFGYVDCMVAIEQPEIHLHPALQAELGDVFIQSALGASRNTFILETHSEHLILRIMRRIRETAEGRRADGQPTIRPEHVAVMYVQPTDAGAVLKELRLDERGELMDPWPGGFFEVGFWERFT